MAPLSSVGGEVSSSGLCPAAPQGPSDPSPYARLYSYHAAADPASAHNAARLLRLQSLVSCRMPGASDRILYPALVA
jgi:hypothetical protein